jgi:hypothetical protein
VTQPSPCPLKPSQQQDNEASHCLLAAAGLTQLAASAPTPASQAAQATSFGSRPPMLFQAGQSSLLLPGFSSRYGASSTQQLRHEEISIDVTPDWIFAEISFTKCCDLIG